MQKNRTTLLKSNRSQGAIEFILILGAVLVFFTSFMLVINYNMSDKYRERESLSAKSLALAIIDEVSLAQKSSSGYIRNFTVPNNINGKSYSTNLTDSWIYIHIPGGASILLPIGKLNNMNSIPNPTAIKIGKQNTIRKNDSGVYLND